MVAPDRTRSVIDALRRRLEAVESEKAKLLAEAAIEKRSEVTGADLSYPER